MGEASDDIKLASGSVIEISKLPGYTMQTKGKITGTDGIFFSYWSSQRKYSPKVWSLFYAVMDEMVSKVDSELLCRAYLYLYLGDDPFDKEAKEKFGTSMLSLF